jgi:cell division cycle protein 20 (cofactor of APC complex)
MSSFAFDMMGDLDDVMCAPVESSVLSRWERKEQKSRSNSKTPGKKMYGDRFIPSREGMNGDVALHAVTNENENPEGSHPEFNSRLAQSLFRGDDLNTKILAFKKKAPKPAPGFDNNLRVLYTQNKAQGASQQHKAFRHISSTPERILDAPDLLDDYYLNLLDWSSANTLAVALGPCIYLWDSATGGIDLLCETESDDHLYTSIKWMEDGSHLAIGTNTNDVQLWNVERRKQVRSMKGHLGRVGALAWNNHILTSGSRDSMIFNHDVRIAQHHVSSYQGHTQEVCGLEWSPDGTQLASGGNDNLCCIWDANASVDHQVQLANGGWAQTARLQLTESQAAVKAVAWSPHERSLLATGSGTADRHIRFYNTQASSDRALVNSIDTNSQVCSLQWSRHSKELLSSHGFSQNQLCVWKYPTMAKIAELTGHTSRVLHTALSADGTTVCSAAADETLRFWKVFEPQGKKKVKRAAGAEKPSRMRMSIR